PSPHPKAGLWHEAQDRRLAADKLVSKYNRLLAERDLFHRVGIIVGEGDRIGSAILRLELLNRGNRCLRHFEGCGFADGRGLTSGCERRGQNSRNCCRKTKVAQDCGSHSIFLKDLGVLLEGNGKELVRL